MQYVVLACVVLVSAVYGYEDHTLTKWHVPTHPAFGQPVYCLTREIMERDRADPTARVQGAIDTCTSIFCQCWDEDTEDNLRSTYTNFPAMQCDVTIDREGTENDISLLEALNAPRKGEYKEFCPRAKACYPDYIECIRDTLPGCVQPALDQCDENLQRWCNEGEVCKDGKFPDGMNAGTIFAITGGIIYLIFLFLFMGGGFAGNKSKQPELDQPEQA